MGQREKPDHYANGQHSKRKLANSRTQHHQSWPSFDEVIGASVQRVGDYFNGHRVGYKVNGHLLTSFVDCKPT